MAYQILARKWRPKDFSEVVGQAPIVTALRNALTDGRIAQAYLFSGIRGIGKTSVARVLAKALNCERGPGADPCNECTSCREISTGADLDVIEVDAATYSKVEQVRELTESLQYGPARNRYKVVVLDEVHRLSRQAFDALLKIVEEPPAHLVFIFATTEIEAVPATILSRCQEFNFRRVPAAEVTEHLRAIAGSEEIQASDAALQMIARAGDGSLRDAVALLDQLATFGGGTIADGDAGRLLGGVSASVLGELLSAVLEGDGCRVSGLVTAVEADGWDPRHVYTQFLGFCRDGLHLAMGGDADGVALPGEEAALLAETARHAGYENLLRLLHQLLTSEQAVRRSELGILALEIALLRAAELPKLIRVEELLAGGSPQAGPQRVTKPPSAAAAREKRPEPPSPEPEEPSGGELEDATGAEPSRPAPAPAPSAPDPPPLPAKTPSVELLLETVARRRQALAAHLAAAHQLVFADGVLRIVAPAGDQWLTKALGREANGRVLDEAVTSTWGAAAKWRLEAGSGPVDHEPPPTVEVDAAVIEHPTVQTLLDVFGGAVETVEPKEDDS